MRLAELKFHDVVFGSDDAMWLQGVRGAHDVELVPNGAHADAKALAAACRQAAEGYGQDEFRLEYDGVFYRVVREMSVAGWVYTLRRPMPTPPTLAELGLHSRVSQRLLDQGLEAGLVVFAGATGSGKTTTASSMLLERLKRYGGVAYTVEDPPELHLHGQHGQGVCFQTPLGDEGFARAIRKVLRANPRTVFLGELRDGRAASQALRAGIDGHLVLTTMHGSGVVESLNRLVALAREDDGDMAMGLLADGLAAVIHQTLDGRPKRLKVSEFMFVGGYADPIRAKIRQRRLPELRTDIDSQMNELHHGHGRVAI